MNRGGKGIVNQQDLIKLAKAGNKEAFIELLRSVETPIYKTAFYYMGNEHDAKDVTQDALIKVYTKLNTFQEKSSFNTWVQRITTNICMDKFRKNKNDISIEGAELEIHEDLNIEDKVETKLLTEELIKYLINLPSKVRATMILRYLHEFSYQEIADSLDIPINTVKSYLFRGRDQLLREYQHRGGVHS